MNNLFINKLVDLPGQYYPQLDTKLTTEIDDTVNYRGKEYQYVGCYEKDYSLFERIYLTIGLLAQAVFPIIGLAFINFQRSWQIIFAGKECVKVYCIPDENGLDDVFAKTDSIGKKGLNFSPKIKEEDKQTPSPKGKEKDKQTPFPKGKEKDKQTPSPEDKKVEKEHVEDQTKVTPQSKKVVIEIPNDSILKTDLGKKTAHVADFSAIEAVIIDLGKRQIAHKKKAALFQKALSLFKSKSCSAELETFRLADQNQFDVHNKPNHFNQIFGDKGHSLNLEATHLFYDYKSTDKHEDFWCDFANASLGGGCFGYGFVQEEIMIAEMPEFANHIAQHLSTTRKGWCDISTREGTLKERSRVMSGSPNPYLLKGLHRVQSVDNHLTYGNKFDKLTQQKLLDSTKPLDIPQKVNILAIAAPKLYSQKRAEQWSFATLADIFNTLMAGFTLVQEQSKNPLIHSGRIGCGVFNNDIHAVYLIHCLAAQQLGVKVKLHGYSAKESHDFHASWNAIAPELAGKTLEECMHIISDHLTKNF